MPSNNQAVSKICILAYENSFCLKKLIDSFASTDKHKLKIEVLHSFNKSESFLTVCNFLQNNSGINFLYTKNIWNLGGITKQFEMAVPHYLWAVGDCNEFGPNCFDPITSQFKKNSPDCIMIDHNGLWRNKIIKELCIYSKMHTLLIVYSYNFLCCINGLICHSPLVKKYFYIGYEACCSVVPHKTAEQKFLVHKMSNILNKLPKSLQFKAKSYLHEIWMSPATKQSDKAFDEFLEDNGVKYPKNVASLKQDREKLMAFYQIAAEHWEHIRSNNPIESACVAIGLRFSKPKLKGVVGQALRNCSNWLRSPAELEAIEELRQKLDFMVKGSHLWMDYWSRTLSKLHSRTQLLTISQQFEY